MKTDIFSLLLVFILKIHVSAAAAPQKGDVCEFSKQDVTATTCVTGYPCHQTHQKCLKLETNDEGSCGVDTICTDEKHVCQGGKCLIKQGGAHSCTASEKRDPKCVANAKCKSANSCACMTGFKAKGNVCIPNADSAIKVGEAGCTAQTDCAGDETRVECDGIYKTCKCRANYFPLDTNLDCKAGNGARGLRPSYLLMAVCFVLTRIFLY